MIKVAIATFLAILTSYFLPFSPLPKPTYHSLFLSTSLTQNSSIAHHLFTLTRRPHIAGSEANSDAAAYVLSTLTSSNFHSRIVSYQAALTYPASRTLTLTPPPPDPPFTFELRQEIYPGDPYADVADEVVPTFHAYAKSGSVSGPVVYVNYGREDDYKTLDEMGVDVSGAVVLARYGQIYRGDIAKNAGSKGAIGALVYTDRKDYGGGGDDGGEWFPDGKWMPPSGVQVGTVYSGIGDPTTPGWPSTEGCERLNNEEVEESGEVPLIPSLPISAADGERILRTIGGQVAKEDWQGSKDGPIYRVGPGPGIVNLSYFGKQFIATIKNIIGVIEGAEEPDRFVILGNHRDAWTFGAVDPNSGTAALLEVAQRFSKLQKRGWKPRRTIILCNWDAEEYGLIGSTEWAEENREMLASRAVAYLNVDSAVCGPGFHASATPQLDELLKRATQQVLDPDNSSQTIYESWFGSSNSEEDTQSTTRCMTTIYGCKNLVIQDSIDMLQKYAKDLEVEISGKDINLTPLLKSIEELEIAATKIKHQIKAIKENEGWRSVWQKDHLKVREVNDRLMMAERAFTDRDGLSGRSWYKHLVYGPSKHNEYGSKSFPAIDDAIIKAKSLNSRESWQSVQHEIWRVARVIKQASQVLHGGLT
ncbi:probable glutamate carboxypeptidase LAMP1 isoform X3 [Ziziphus jujuba]|uniref:Probable glutamate carboxypeptidase LAMP1 isoform X3 n=1 Tax=Ziziphus jujuba TaxID=326968 RepID=A0ABM3ZVG9_ZIZJJ|nr:probable glutamate carboxypeptidase LAMP1 isoform X3 [Ziziphus jujuba]